MREFVAGQQGAGRRTVSAKLLLLGLDGYELDEGIQQLTDENAAALKAEFSPLGGTATITIATPEGEEEASASDVLRQRVKTVLDEIDGKTDIILDVSSLPRATYLALLTNILQKLVPDKTAVEGAAHPLYANGVNFQVLVAEDAKLDGQIRAEDPSNDPLNIPGFFAAWQAEGVQDWPLVWFPVLGEGRGEPVAEDRKLNPDGSRGLPGRTPSLQGSAAGGPPACGVPRATVRQPQDADVEHPLCPRVAAVRSLPAAFGRDAALPAQHDDSGRLPTGDDPAGKQAHHPGRRLGVL